VQTAVSAGRILPAEAEAKVNEILAANDVPAAIHDLGKLEAKFKTASTTGDLGNAKARLVVAANDQAAAERAERTQLVANEFENTNPALSMGERKRLAWRRAEAKKPELFATSKRSSGAAA
jgi:ABC-type ATPase involved in cell division